MESSTSQSAINDAVIEESDYGSDIDEASLDAILNSNPESQPIDSLVLISTEQDPLLEDAAHLQPLPKQISGYIATDTQRRSTRATSIEVLLEQAEVEISSGKNHVYAVNALTDTDTKRLIASGDVRLIPSAKAEDQEALDDKRSPLERFRTKPKKPLSVTDIVSPAWCEQQYLYSLSKYGRIKQTPAMRQGSSVHKVLEEQVHTTVPIQVKTREDMFGLRIWNIIQGLRTLRATGLTREFEIWGVVEGQVINGIIDEITTQCPDKGLAARIAGRDTSSKVKEVTLETNQKTLTDFFKGSQQGAGILEKGLTKPDPSTPLHYYLIDHKTRQSSSLPDSDSRLRPTKMQLMLYHRLISDLAAGNVDAENIFTRYSLDSTAIFSDLFIAEISNLDESALEHAGFPSSAEETPDAMTELLNHNSLASLWSHMIEEFGKTIGDPSTSISPVLAAEFRTATNGQLIGRRSFAMDNKVIGAYVEDELQWWTGGRPTKGVEIEDAFKCRMCDFAHGCTWRQGKVEETIKKARSRKAAAAASNG